MPKFKERSVQTFRDKLTGGGTRPNLFEVQITPPDYLKEIIDQDIMKFMVKAAEIPAANIGNIPVPFRGRVLPIAGDRTFDPWTVTIINDQKFNIRDAMEQWTNLINDLQFAGGDINPADYQTKAEVFQLGRNAKNAATDEIGSRGIPILRQYNFEGIYPNTVSSIPLDYGATDQIQEFQVTFNYLFWTVEGGLGTNANNSQTAGRTGTFSG